MVYCCVGGCTNDLGRQSSSFRHFLRFYNFPKDKVISKKWVARINRRPCDVRTKTMHVCSDHFCDEDFVLSNFLRSKISFSDKMHIPLKQDSIPNAIPNTDRQTGEKHIKHAMNQSLDQGSSSRKSYRFNLDNLESIIHQNEEILKLVSSPSVLDQSEAKKQEQQRDLAIGNENQDLNSKPIQCCVGTKYVHCKTEESCLNHSNELIENSRSKYDSCAESDISNDLPVEYELRLETVYSGKVDRKTEMKIKQSVSSKSYSIKWVIVNIQKLLPLFKLCLNCGFHSYELFTTINLCLRVICRKFRVMILKMVEKLNFSCNNRIS